MGPFDINWFLTTAYGASFAGFNDALTYDFALNVAEAELTNVKCNCPKLYPYALQIKIYLILSQMNLAEPNSGQVSSPALTGGKIAYVTHDKVYDTERSYSLVDEPRQQQASSPTGILQGIIARCTMTLGIGAHLVRSLPLGNGCGCAPLGLDNGALNDMGFADKSDS
jgi:hypothetical protein